MDEILLVLLIVVIILLVLNMVFVLKNKPKKEINENDIERIVKDIIDININRINDKLDSLVLLLKENNNSLFEKVNVKLDNSEKEIESLKDSFKNTNELINNKLNELLKDNFELINQIKEKLSFEIKEFNNQVKVTLNEFNTSVIDNLKEIRSENKEKLDEINKVVNEKLENTLNERLRQSFNNVIEQIGGVNKAIGEIKGLASDVGSLKTVLTNVKTKGIVGEIILSNIIKETLTVGQYDENVVTKKGSTERVEFAIKLPNNDDSFIYLPLDSKLPLDAYHRIADASNSGNVEELKAARADLKNQIRKYASDISSKYIDVPNTTDFAIMFLPLEGLYVEVLNLGLFEELREKYHVNIAGPTTFTAILNALQMGFKTLAIERKSSDVFKLLGAVKTEFSKFAGVLEKAQKKVSEASKELDTLVGTRTRMIESKLKSIEKIDEELSSSILEIEEG